MPVNLPTASHPAHVCYVKSTWGDQWVEAPLLRCRAVTDQAAPAHATGQFSYRYGKAILPKQGTRPADTDKATIARPNLVGWYVKVVIDTDPEITWYGVIADVTDSRGGDLSSVPTGAQNLTAYGLTLLLERSFPITKTFVKTGTGAPQLVDVCIPFNGGTDGRNDRSRVASANYDSTAKAFTSSDVASPSYWTAATAAAYLLTNFAPRNVDEDAIVPFQISESSGLNYRLPFFEYDGQNLWQILNRLVPRQRGLGFHATVSNAGVITLNVFSHSKTALPLPSGGTVPANTNTTTMNFTTSVNIESATITTSAIHTYDQVIARGARVGSVFTIAPTHNLNEDWSEESEDDYNAALAPGNDDESAAANADYRARDALHDVFSHWELPEDWEGHGVKLSDESDVLAVYSLDADGTPDLDVAGTFWRAGLRFENYVPLRAQVDYSGAVTPADDGDGLTEYLAPILCVSVADRWVYGERLDAAADSGFSDRQHTWTIQTRVRTDKPGLVLEVVGGQQHFLASDRFEPDGDSEDIPDGQGINLNDFAATVYLPLQQRLVARMPEEPVSGDVARTLVIDVADAHLDALIPGTVVGINDAGELVEATGGWLRDDRLRLRDIATIAWVWYGTPRQTIDVKFRSISAAFAVGQIVTSVVSASGTEQINTVVTSIELDLQRGMTSVKTQYDELDFGGLV